MFVVNTKLNPFSDEVVVLGSLNMSQTRLMKLWISSRYVESIVTESSTCLKSNTMEGRNFKEKKRRTVRLGYHGVYGNISMHMECSRNTILLENLGCLCL